MKNTSNKSLLIFRLTGLLVFAALLLSASVVVAEIERSDINVTITTHLGDDQHFQSGDEISLLLNLDRDAYLLLVYRDAGGNLVKLFPVRKNDNGWVPAGDFMPFPRRGDRLRLIVAPPFGEEQVWVFASDTPLPTGLMADAGDINTLRARLQRPGVVYDEAYTQLVTHAGNR